MTDVFSEIAHVISKLLPRLADRFQNQKGHNFGLGDDDGTNPVAMYETKLDNAPIHNLDNECCIGFINYELAKRGATILSCASTAQVKTGFADLLESLSSGSFSDFKKVVGKSEEIPAIIDA